MRYNRFLPLVVSLLVLLLSEAFFFHPRMIYVVLVLINSLIFFVLWQFSKASIIDKKWWNFLILPSVMSSLVIIYSIFLPIKAIIQSLFILNVVLLYLYLRYVYYYLVKPAAYEVFSIENISSLTNFLTFFLLAAIIYGLQSFLDMPIWLLMLAMLVTTAIVTYQIVWVNKIDFRKGLPYIFICCFILVELGWSISFLPFDYNIAGLSLAICYYILIGLVKNYLLDKLDSKKIKIYLGFGLVSLFFILITTSWF